MDGICSAVLNKIYALGGTGRYFIVSADEFFETFPEDGERSPAELNRALKYLKDAGYLDIKYSGGDLYCVALLKEYAPAAETPAPPPPPPAPKTLPTFAAALLGGALGGIVTSLFSLLFLLC